jgi:hypothetical protein
MNLKVSLSETFSEVRAALGRARLSVVEIVFLVAALLYAGFVAFFYFNKVQPLGSEIAAREQRITDSSDRIKKLDTDAKKRGEQAANAKDILESLRGFDGYLKPDGRGSTQIIDEIDALGKKHQVITGDSAYRPEKADEQQVDENGVPIPQAARNDKRPKIYPTLGIDTTVLGDYSNLRRFLSDLERSRQFLIINALSFQGGDDKVTRQLAKGGKQLQLSGPEAVPVSLRIELETYFQSPTSAAALTASTAPAATKNER